MRFFSTILFLSLIGFEAASAENQISLLLADTFQSRTDKVYNYAPTPDWPPLDYVDENGEFRGLLTDIVRMIERQHGLKLNWVAYPDWSSVYEDLKSGKLHFSAGLHQNEERNEFILFTEPFMTVPSVVLVRKDGPVSRNTDLNTTRIAAVRNYANTAYLKENYRQAEVVEFETELAALISTSFGTTDAVVLDIVNASHLMQVYGFPNLAIGPEFEFVWEMRFGVHRDSPELFLLLSEVVSKMDINDKNRELQSFVNTYIPQFSYLERYKRQPFCTDYGCSAFCALPYFHQSST